MRTYIYIDGNNLYYGCLHQTPYKWLDIYKLFADFIIKKQSPQSHIETVKFFTADIRAKLATHGQAAHHAQDTYHRALEYCYPDNIEVIKGYYALDRAILPRYKHPPDRADSIDVWKLEEKQTDVNLALHCYRDAVVQKSCDQVIIVSNDTDIAPAIELLRADTNEQIEIGVVIPVHEPEPNTPRRPTNKQLSQHAHWTRHYILEEELKGAQLPAMIPTRRKPIRKPDFW